MREAGDHRAPVAAHELQLHVDPLLDFAADILPVLFQASDLQFLDLLPRSALKFDEKQVEKPTPTPPGPTGFAMPGPMNLPQAMAYDTGATWFAAYGVPITP